MWNMVVIVSVRVHLGTFVISSTRIVLICSFMSIFQTLFKYIYEVLKFHFLWGDRFPAPSHR